MDAQRWTTTQRLAHTIHAQRLHRPLPQLTHLPAAAERTGRRRWRAGAAAMGSGGWRRQLRPPAVAVAANPSPAREDPSQRQPAQPPTNQGQRQRREDSSRGRRPLDRTDTEGERERESRAAGREGRRGRRERRETRERPCDAARTGDGWVGEAVEDREGVDPAPHRCSAHSHSRGRRTRMAFAPPRSAAMALLLPHPRCRRSLSIHSISSPPSVSPSAVSLWALPLHVDVCVPHLTVRWGRGVAARRLMWGTGGGSRRGAAWTARLRPPHRPPPLTSVSFSPSALRRPSSASVAPPPSSVPSLSLSLPLPPRAAQLRLRVLQLLFRGQPQPWPSSRSPSALFCAQQPLMLH